MELRGARVVLYLFSLRMSCSGRSVQWVFASGGQEAFLEGHVHAFTQLGGVPHGKIRYDNLKPAVAKVLGLGRPEPNLSAGPRSPATTASTTRSTASPASRGRTRRAVSRARSATTDAITSSPSLL